MSLIWNQDGFTVEGTAAWKQASILQSGTSNINVCLHLKPDQERKKNLHEMPFGPQTMAVRCMLRDVVLKCFSCH